jgi:transposase
MQRAHKNTVIVALANKLARIVWAVLRRGGTYNAAALTAA